MYIDPCLYTFLCLHPKQFTNIFSLPAVRYCNTNRGWHNKAFSTHSTGMFKQRLAVQKGIVRPENEPTISQGRKENSGQLQPCLHVVEPRSNGTITLSIASECVLCSCALYWGEKVYSLLAQMANKPRKCTHYRLDVNFSSFEENDAFVARLIRIRQCSSFLECFCSMPDQSKQRRHTKIVHACHQNA